MGFKLQDNYEPMARFSAWDEQTKEVLARRLSTEIGQDLSFRFFDAAEGKWLQRIADVLLGQSVNGHQIKFAEIIDARLAGPRSGVRYGDNPWHDEFYRQGLAEFRRQFDLEGRPGVVGITERLERFIAKKLQQEPPDMLEAFLRRVLKDAAEIFYSHPASWKEIGFPGPAYPEGYPYLKCDQKEDWEPEYVQP